MKSVIMFLSFVCLFGFIFPLAGEGVQQGENIVLIPMYGGAEKTEAQLALDENFIKEITAATGSREKGSQEFVKMGWKVFLVERNPATAMMRFNQAWLLDPDNPDVLWGFGAVSGAMGKTADSVKFLRQAADKLGDNAMVLTDLGFSLTIYANEPENAETASAVISEAVSCFERAEKIKPEYEPLYSNWAVTLFSNKDYAGAWDKIGKAEALGGKTVNPMFVKDLESKMPRPAR